MANARPPYFFLVCPDSRLLQERVEQLASRHAPAGSGWERHVFWGEEGLGERFWSLLTLENLLGTSRLLVIRHAEKLKAEAWHHLNAALNRCSSQAFPLFCLEADWDRGKPKLPEQLKEFRGKPPLPCWTLAVERGWSWQSPGLSPNDVTRRLQDWAKAEGLGLAPGAIQALQAVLPLNASALEGELEKLRLAARAAAVAEDGSAPVPTITPEMAALVHETAEFDLFAFLEMVQRGGGAKAVSMWKHVLESALGGQSITFGVLAVTARELRTLWQIRHGESVSLPPFILNKKEPLARRLAPAVLAQGLELLHETERSIKSGEKDESQALELLIAGLARAFAPGPAGSSGGPGSPGAGGRPAPGGGRR
ncbi:DNA polymerase III subunit delta [Megalodesulfovibrio paquesii]